MDRQDGNFVWDVAKEIENIRKHEVDFETAAKVFTDARRQIYVDTRHSGDEERFFCVGRVEGRIVTVRFSYRGGSIRIFGAGYWRKGRRDYEASKAGP